MDQNDKKEEVQSKGKGVTLTLMHLGFKPNLQKYCLTHLVVLLPHLKTTICEGFCVDRLVDMNGKLD